jgi:ABC-2 type transport system permease protein
VTIRDLGYRRYEGPRLPPSNGIWVMFVHGLSLAIRSWVFWLSLIPALLAAGMLDMFGVFTVMQGQALTAGQLLMPAFTWVVGLFAIVATAAIATTVIADDLGARAFPFYFSKMLSPTHYLLGRITAVAGMLAGYLSVPLVLSWLAFVAIAPEEERSDAILTVVPLVATILFTAIVLAVLAVSCSALSNSRAVPMSVWLAGIYVPFVASATVNSIAGPEGWPWLSLVSVLHLLGTMARAIFKTTDADRLTWPMALAALTLWCGMAVFGAYRRIARVEVVS